MAESRTRSNRTDPPVGGDVELRATSQPSRPRRSSQCRAIRQKELSLAIDSELSSNYPITAREIEAICLLLGDDLDGLFDD